MVSWFDKKQGGAVATSAHGPAGPRVPRHSGSWAVLRKRLQAEPGLRIIDVGYTSPNNINYLTDLGHSVFLSDLVHDEHVEFGNRNIGFPGLYFPKQFLFVRDHGVQTIGGRNGH